MWIQVVSDNTSRFKANFRDIFVDYPIHNITDTAVADKWFTNPFQFWQTQLNFVAWCATGGCGVSVMTHCSNSNPMVASVYTFHVYYQMRRLLNELSIPLPNDPTWSATNNPYNQASYMKLCREFQVNPNTDWRQKRTAGIGHTLIWVQPWGRYTRGPTYKPGKFHFNDEHSQYSNDYTNVKYASQGSGANDAWTTFLLDKGAVGFTRAGVARINDSIRTYVYCLLTAQYKTRSSILGTGTAFNAQRQFIHYVEDSIINPSGLETRYENALHYARSKVDFVYGDGLYMSPSNMDLHLGGIANYSNHVFIASRSKIGKHSNINALPAPVNTHHIPTIPAPVPNHKKVNTHQPPTIPAPVPNQVSHHIPTIPAPVPNQVSHHIPAPVPNHIPASHIPTIPAQTPHNHNEEKTALVIAMTSIFVFLLAFR